MSDERVQRLFEKAIRLIEEGRVVQISPLMFYVVGDHGKYFVHVNNGIVRCLCPGYKRRGFCSHIIAVLLLVLRDDYRKTLEEGLRRRLEHQLDVIRQGSYIR